MAQKVEVLAVVLYLLLLVMKMQRFYKAAVLKVVI